MIERKGAVVEQTTKGDRLLDGQNKIEVYHGMGSFKDATHIEIASDDKTKPLKPNTVSSLRE